MDASFGKSYGVASADHSRPGFEYKLDGQLSWVLS